MSRATLPPVLAPSDSYDTNYLILDTSKWECFASLRLFHMKCKKDTSSYAYL